MSTLWIYVTKGNVKILLKYNSYISIVDIVSNINIILYYQLFFQRIGEKDGRKVNWLIFRILKLKHIIYFYRIDHILDFKITI